MCIEIQRQSFVCFFFWSDEDAPLNLSTKPSDSSSNISHNSRKSEIWSPGSVCEREAQETRPKSSWSPTISSTPAVSRLVHYSPLTPPSSSERTFQVSFLHILFINNDIIHVFVIHMYTWSASPLRTLLIILRRI